MRQILRDFFRLEIFGWQSLCLLGLFIVAAAFTRHIGHHFFSWSVVILAVVILLVQRLVDHRVTWFGRWLWQRYHPKEEEDEC